MTRDKKSKNITTVDGVERHKRWTILNVDSVVVDTVKTYATKNGYATERALKELVLKGLKHAK